MAKNLLIVESPAKAKTIEKYLGEDFLVKSSFGHIRDLVKTDDAIDVNNGFVQKYEVPADKIAVVKELKQLAKKMDTVWLASDEDREGEAIAWHLFDTLELDDAKTKRIVFHEITKNAIQNAVKNPRTIDYNLVYAQQARRVLDRLVGFELSPILWRKVRPSLSAGRVQSVAVRLIVEREREINRFDTDTFYKVVALFKSDKQSFKAELSEKFTTIEQAQKFVEDCSQAHYTIESVETKPAKRSPSAPFTTSTLQQEASRKLGFSVSRTMTVAQRLYESGKITYMRTDSVNLSDFALQEAEKEIKSAYGDRYHRLKKYQTKSSGAQEAHEAIRPTDFSMHIVEGEPAEKRLYELIWKRAIASQMSEAEFEKTTAKIHISTRKEQLIATGEVIVFDGFLKVYLESKDEDSATDAENNTLLPPLKQGQIVSLTQLDATQRFSRPAARYTEASLVKKLEELGIGRPSTYAPTISTVQNRGYVIKEDREGKTREYNTITLKDGIINKDLKTEIVNAEKSKLFPTDIGAVVNDFLVQYFHGVVDFHFTAKVEKEFDEIAQGMKEWTTMIDNFYKPFHQDVQKTIDSAERANGERVLGTDPKTDKKISVRIGKYGPFVQIGDSEGEEKPVYASLRKGQMIENITLEEALDLFKLPRMAGVYQDKDLVIGIGRFGPYVKHNNSFYSLPKEVDPMLIDEGQAIQIILDKQQKDAERLIKTFDENPEVKILNGRWGPYIAFGKQNLKIPKDMIPDNLTYQDCVNLSNATTTMPNKSKKRTNKSKK